MSIPVAQETAPLLLVPRRVPWGLLGLLALAFIAVPLWGNDYWLNAILIPFLVLSLAGLGLEPAHRLHRTDIGGGGRLHGRRRVCHLWISVTPA